MQKITIAVDIDEVLSPWHKNILAFHNDVYDTNFVTPNGSRYYISEYTNDPEHIITQKIKAFAASHLFAVTQPIKGSVEALTKLKRQYRLVIVTSRHDFLKDQTHAWLEKYFPGVFEAVHFTDGIAKSEICKRVGAELIIEDHLSHAKVCAESGVKVLLFGNYCWNRIESGYNNILPVKDWGEVTKLLLTA